MAFSVARRLQRVDRIDGVTGSDQRLDPRPAVGLDPDQHLLRLGTLLQVITDQGVQDGQTGHPLRKSTPDLNPALVIFDLDVVMGLGPVITDEQSPSSSLHLTASESDT